MDSLANYGSDGENSNNSDDIKIPTTNADRKKRVINYQAHDANYDPVQMDMSEESNNNHSSGDSDIEKDNSSEGISHKTAGISRSSCSHTSSNESPPDQRHSSNDSHGSHNRSEESKRANVNDGSNNKYGERSSRHSDDSTNRYRRPSDDGRKRTNSDRNSDRKESKRLREDDRRSRDNDRRKDKCSSLKDDKDHSHRDDRRNDKRRERDRRPSRSSRIKDRHRDDKLSSYQKEKDKDKDKDKEKEHRRSRSRSKSKDHTVPNFKPMSYREEKGRNKLAQLEKLGIELKTPEGTINPQILIGEQNFYNPLTTAAHGKYAEQIQKRKLLWANKPKQDDGKNSNQVGSNTWVGTTFTHDQDGKMTAKFKRLMGIKEDTTTNPPVIGQKPDILKKQEEMFNNMEQQYEVARATTHTQRGVGLGYASGYQFPR